MNQNECPVTRVEVRQANNGTCVAESHSKNVAKRRPETATIALALLEAFVMQFERGVAPAGEIKNLIFAMMSTLIDDGHSGKEVMIVMRQLRKRLREERGTAVAN